MKPSKILRPHPDLLSCEWNDGYSATITLERFRELCPCAQCTSPDEGKSKLAQFVEMTLKAERYELKELVPVGNYAVKAVWGDGHDIGLYRWDYIRMIFEENRLSDNEINSLLENK